MKSPTKPDTRPWWIANVRFVGGRVGILKFRAAHLAEARRNLSIRGSIAAVLSVNPLPQ